MTPQDKAVHFKSLHAKAFLMPNAWDAGSAKMLAGLGFQALATSSGAAAGVLGRKDGQLTRAEAIAHARAIVESVDIPVSADLENGFGHTAEDVAETIRLATTIGLAGGSIEDASGDASKPLYDFDHAVERVAAAVAAARASRYPFTLTARAENYLRGNPNLDDTIRRLQAFEKAGVDVLFAPGLPDLAAVRAVCAALTKPVSFMVGIKGKSFSVAELEAAGVKRISLATSLYRAAMKGARDAAQEVVEHGTFTYLDRL
jgi:2-methylisocitrate lyase-like PEP mutase family enzyme